ncbi:MAG: 2-hydroxyhepta-2,4-diene-1,7-dioate isomerase [Gemmataceae bacterium]|nr:2-hydroxyhepta-2,4-diene-1,7-dioate isomerase [Gemmataceae bacterium]
MQIGKFQLPSGDAFTGLLEGEFVFPLGSLETQPSLLTQILHADDPRGEIAKAKGNAPALLLKNCKVLAPIDLQEVWAAGVTYLRSREARERESEGAARFYDLVYKAERPELFMKSMASKVVGPGMPVRVRKDSKWNVPEPELTLVISPKGNIVGYTIGNDMSSRDIEGENPLYLPQAKIYTGACAIGPWITLHGDLTPLDQCGIHLTISRLEKAIFQGKTTLASMARGFEDLAQWLFKENHFPDGVFLLTGTGIVPPDHFNLQSGDHVKIEIDGIGGLENPVQ